MLLLTMPPTVNSVCDKEKYKESIKKWRHLGITHILLFPVWKQLLHINYVFRTVTPQILQACMAISYARNGVLGIVDQKKHSGQNPIRILHAREIVELAMARCWSSTNCLPLPGVQLGHMIRCATDMWPEPHLLPTTTSAIPLEYV